MEGWIKLHRSLLDNPVVCKDSDYMTVWIYILLNATHKKHNVIFNKEKISLMPGQLLTGRKSISEKLNMSESKVQRILKSFENEQQIEQQMSNQNRLISIVKWSEYQDSEQRNEQQVNNERTASEQPVNTNKNEKKEKNEKKKDTTEVAAVLSYYDSLDNLPKYKGLSAQRKSHVNARINEYGVEEVKTVLAKADASDFLKSSIGGKWYNFDWIFNPTNFLKILECNYDNKDEEQRKVIRLETKQGLVYNNSKNGFARRLTE